MDCDAAALLASVCGSGVSVDVPVAGPIKCPVGVCVHVFVVKR